MAFGQEVQRIITDNIIVEAVRIAHAGWPQRKNIQNIVFRVEIKDDVTVMHLGDADPNSIHFSPYQKHWSSKITDTAFPPYWFYLSEQGKELIETTLNTKSSIGIHVPKKIPKNLVESDKVFFHLPGETAVVLEANRNQK